MVANYTLKDMPVALKKKKKKDFDHRWDPFWGIGENKKVDFVNLPSWKMPGYLDWISPW